ncbi:MAG TPA: TonB-dependent receptor, partial [Pseudoduganella sp.]
FYSNLTKNGNAISTALANNVYPLVRGMYTRRRDDIRALGWNNELRLDGVKLVADLSWSKAKRNELSLENNLQVGAVNSPQYLDTVNLAFNAGTFPTMAPGRADYSDASNLYVKNTIYGSGYGKVPYVEDELKSVKLAANFQAPVALENWFSGFDIGVNYSDRSKDKDQPEGNINLVGNPTTIDPSLLYGSVDLGFAGVGNVPAWNVPAVVARYMTFNPTAGSGAILIKNWSVAEKISTAYAKANIEHEFGNDISLRGNVGVQVQHTKQYSDSKYFNGALASDQQVQPIHDGKSYNDWLPSMNLNFGLPNDQTVRVALAKQIARPRVDQLRAALDFGVSDTTFKPGASGGNAQLDPWRAKAFDLSYEKYFGKKAYLAGAFFFKKLDTYIFTQTKTYDFSAFVPGTKANTVFGDYKAPYNGNGGTMRGIELSGSMPLSMLTPVLDGFGIVASGTYTDSNIAIQEPDGSIGQNIPLPGLSKRVTNLTVYYEKNGFETRLSQRKRSDFVGEIGNFAAERSLRYVVGESILDLQLAYTFQNGPLKDVGVVLQANNLRNAAYETYNGSTNQQLEYQKYGRTVLLGLNYKF